jgi:PAS domain S-box-containing protein
VVGADFQAPFSTPATAVLIVEDDPFYAEFVRATLRRARGTPLTILHASSLATAEAILSSHDDISVVLLDLHLPDGNGQEWLATRRSTFEAAVIILTGDAGGTPSTQVITGAQDFLVKSEVDPEHLIRTVVYAADRERTRRQLIRSREYFQSLIERARDLITVLDESGMVLYQSPASLHVLGREPLSLVGHSLFELIVPDQVLGARALIRAVLEGRDATPGGEFSLYHENGSLRTLDIVVSRIPSAGGRRRVVLNSRDITERRRAEDALRERDEQLRQAYKMEAVGRLAGGIAHDFSNVLTVITHASERLQDDLQSGHPSPAQIDVILRNCERAASLTRQLLAFSRQQTLAPTVLDIGALVAGTGELLKQLIGEHICLALDIASDLLAVEADRTQLEQVLMNLVINARDAMPNGGSLRIRLRNTCVSEEFTKLHPPMTPGEWVLLEVSDTGHGMTSETKARVFEPFFTTKSPVHGTGLGLSTAYGIVKQSGGFIWIDSVPGEGSTFSVFLPPTRQVPVAPDVPCRATGTAETTYGATILLTEDEPDVRCLLRDVLAAQGYTVVEATSPAEALERAAAHPGRIDLLLTDIVMPGGTGRDLARTISAERPDLKVLYMSGYPEHGAAPGTVLEPGAPFLPKPFTRDLLLEHVRLLLT